MKSLGLVAAIGLSLYATAASATVTLSGNYSVSSNATGSKAPAISDIFNTTINKTLNGLGGAATTPVNFFSVTPTTSSCFVNCSGSTETDALTINFTNLKISGLSGVNATTVFSGSASATFTADYNSSDYILGCAVGDGSSGNKAGASNSKGQSDCIDWSGAGTAYNGVATLQINIGGGDALDIFLYNGSDWTVTTQIGFKVVDAPPTTTPEPATLAIGMTALAGIGAARLRRRRLHS